MLGAGWDNTVFTVGDEWVFRFPRREVVLPGFRLEIELLPELAPLLPVPIPVPEHIGAPSEAFPWPFFGARMLPGVELCEAPETSASRRSPSSWRAFSGRSTAREVMDAVGERLPENWTRRADMELRVPTIARQARRARRALARRRPTSTPLLEEARSLPPPEPRAVCHGDLHFRHVLVDDGRVSGVIDWIDLCRGDPALDLQLVWSALPPESRAAFFAEYGDVDEADAVARTRRRGVPRNGAPRVLPPRGPGVGRA